jgi:hypothetical protein
MGVGLATADELWMPLDRWTAVILHTDELVGDRVIEAPQDHSVDDFNQAVVGHAHAEIDAHPDDVARVDKLRLPDLDRPFGQITGGDFIRAATDGINAPARRKGHHRYRRRDQ